MISDSFCVFPFLPMRYFSFKSKNTFGLHLRMFAVLSFSLHPSLTLSLNRCKICWRVYRFTLLYLENRSEILFEIIVIKKQDILMETIVLKGSPSFIYWLYRDLNLSDEKIRERKVINEQKEYLLQSQNLKNLDILYKYIQCYSPCSGILFLFTCFYWRWMIESTV